VACPFVYNCRRLIVLFAISIGYNSKNEDIMNTHYEPIMKKISNFDNFFNEFKLSDRDELLHFFMHELDNLSQSSKDVSATVKCKVIKSLLLSFKFLIESELAKGRSIPACDLDDVSNQLDSDIPYDVLVYLSHYAVDLLEVLSKSEPDVQNLYIKTRKLYELIPQISHSMSFTVERCKKHLLELNNVLPQTPLTTVCPTFVRRVIEPKVNKTGVPHIRTTIFNLPTTRPSSDNNHEVSNPPLPNNRSPSDDRERPLSGLSLALLQNPSDTVQSPFSPIGYCESDFFYFDPTLFPNSTGSSTRTSNAGKTSSEDLSDTENPPYSQLSQTTVEYVKKLYNNLSDIEDKNSATNSSSDGHTSEADSENSSSDGHTSEADSENSSVDGCRLVFTMDEDIANCHRLTSTNEVPEDASLIGRKIYSH